MSRNECRGVSSAGSINAGIISRVAAFLLTILLSLVSSGVSAQAQDVDWLLSMSDTGFDPIPAGGTIDYVIAIDNNGFDPAPATTVDIDVAAGTSLVGLSGDLTNCLPATGAGPITVTCDVPGLASLQQITQVVQIQTTVAGVVTLAADIPTAGDILPSNNDDSEDTTVVAGADIGLTLALVGTAPAGGVVDFVFEATNNGPDPSNGFTIDFPVPTGVANVVPPAGCTLSGSTYSCAIPGVVAPGNSVTRTFSGQIAVGDGSDITATGSVVGASPADPISENNTVVETLTVTGGTDLNIDKTRVPGGPLLTGDSVTFVLAADYTGDSPNGITITDTIPANYAITSVTPSAGSGWACTVTGQDIECTQTSGSGPGANVSLGSIDVVVDVVSAGTPVNTATITAAGPAEQNLANNSDTDGGATISDPVVDLRANKSGPVPALAVVGNNYGFNISTSNIGNADFFGTIEMVDTVPAGLTVNSYTLNGWSCLPAAPQSGPVTVTCSRVYTSGSPLAAGATTPSVGFNTTVTAPGVITNSLTVGSPDANIADLNAPNDTITYSVTAEAGGDSADVGAVKGVSLAMLPVGDVQTFTLEITNTGPQSALDVDVVDNFTNLINSGVGATGQGYISHAIAANAASGISCGTTSTGGTSRRLNCTITTLPVCTPGVDCPVITVQVRPGGNGGARTNTFSAISQTTPDPNLGDNSDSASYTVDARADMTVTKNANPDPVAAGQNLTYVVAAQNLNNGLSQAAGVTIADTLPADMTFISASGPGATCSTTPAVGSVTGPGNDQVICALGTINNGAQRSVTIVVRPNNAVQGTVITNSVDVATTTTEIDLTNNSATVDVTVDVPDTDILVNKIDSVDPLTIGDDTVYTVTVTNAGPSASENVVMTDTLPPALVTYQSHVVSGAGTCGTVPAVNAVGGTLECSWPYLAAGASESVQVTMRGIGKGTVDNFVSISSDEIVGGWDRLSANNQTDQDTTLRTRTDVALTKTGPGGSVELLEDFDFIIDVAVNTGLGLAEADNVEVTDNLPTNMELTGTPVAVVISGSATANSCTGAGGSTSFTCDLGTVTAGSLVRITVPVQITAATGDPQTYVNPASVTTSSFDQDTSNNNDTASVDVVSSSIAGTVFRDFADDAAITGGDSGIAGVPMTLTGTDVDGNTVTRNTVTDGSGNYIFDFLPEGTYTITRGTVSEPYLTHGQNTAGSEGGGTPSQDVIDAIPLPAATDATEYLFAEIPQARVGIAKALQGAVSENGDGSFNATFGLTVENFSLESLINISVTDQLSGATPLFGTLATPADPANDPLTPGTYAILAAPSGSCGGLNAGFDGSGNTTAASGFTLPIGGTCTIAFSLRVQPLVPVPAGYENQAVVDATGGVSGQTSATNPQLTDLSDDGANPDADNDGQGNEPGENDPTPLAPAYAPSIALIKTADTSALSSPVIATDIVTYNFEVVNTGNVTLTGITLTDILPGIVLSGGPIASLAPGASDTTTFTATYELTQPDVDAGFVENQATTSGTDPFATVVTDPSGTTTGDDTPLITPLVDEPSIALVKTADATAFQSPPQAGDQISYAFTMTNTGNVTLTNVTLADTLPGIVLSGGPIASLAPGASDATTFTATYQITLPDIVAGQVQNTATATGTPPSGPDVTDDSGTDATNDDPTIVPITQAPSILLDKVADNTLLLDGSDVGDPLPYTFTVTNTGNTPLTNITIADTLPGVVLSGGPIPVLNPGEVDSTTFTAIYTLTAADISAGEVINLATVTGTFGPGPGDVVTDDDTETAQVGKIEAIPEVFPPFDTDGGTTTSMLASDLLNNAPATLSNVTITVIAEDPGVTLDPATGLITLAPGNAAGEYTVEYQICSIDVPTLCDSTVETVVQAAIPGIEVTKTQTFTDNGDGRDDVGDLVDYVITVENTGNVPLSNIVLVDTLTDLNGLPLTLDAGPTFVSADQGSGAGNLEIGEVATYSASFTLTLQAVNAGGVQNSVEATALPVFGAGVPGVPEPISDVSDNGIDSDGNTEDDPTVLLLSPAVSSGGITLTKTTPEQIVERGAVVPYTITIANDNTFVAGPLEVVDTLPAHFHYVPGSATLNGAAATVTVTGGRITWSGVTVPAQGSITATLQARILNGARAGSHTNNVSLFDSATGGLLVGPASALVRILPEAVFDCSDVIGKVFEDHNGNGYQDDPDAAADGAITDQTYSAGKYGAKYGVAPESFDEERGIPNVRIVAPDGTIITTDENGLYSVPCAALPADRGSNFILKVDDRSLPSGYRLTTENPRVMRLTPGMMAEMNFGAAIGRVVRVDLNNAAFVADGAGGTALSPALQAGLRKMVAQLAGEPVNIRLAFHVPADATAEQVKAARRLMGLVEDQVGRDWRKAGRARLLVEKTIVRAGQ